MIAQTPWLNREFRFDQPIGVYPALLERLRGTPARAEKLAEGLSETILATRVNDKWSVTEHVGHLIDLQSLDNQRLNEFLNGAKVLSAADMRNLATQKANHRHKPLADIIQAFTVGRYQLVGRLEVLSEDDVRRVALHPRLQQPMRLLDWVYFVAEHDDHHLSLARAVISALESQRLPQKR
jgi:hypothetical protein